MCNASESWWRGESDVNENRANAPETQLNKCLIDTKRVTGAHNVPVSFFFALVLFLYYHFATILVAISTASLFLRCNFFNRSIIIIRYFLYTSHPRYAWPYVYTWIFTAAVCAIFFFFRLFFFLLFSVASVQFPTCTDYNITYAPVVCSTFSRLVFNFSGVSVLLLTDNDCRCIAPCACLHIHNE